MHPARAALEAAQLAQLQRLMRALQPDNKFYTRKFQSAGVPEVASLADFSLRVPFTTKPELVEDQTAHPPYGSNLTYPLHRYTRFSQTSGSSGNPIRWLDTAQSWDWMVGNWCRVFEAASVGPADHIYFAFSFGPFLGFWTAFEAANRLGCLTIPGGGMRTVVRLRTILDTEATVLCCTPTYALRLAESAAEEKIDISKSSVRRIIVAGEPGGSIPSTRALIEKQWPGSSVVDHHGMTETGPVSYGCPHRPNLLHIIESGYIAEVIDPVTGSAAQRGELVLTNLGRTGSPLIRYRTGDIVERAAASQCSCGSWDMALEGGILGRTDDMVVVRGINIYPTAIEDVVRAFEGVAEYRVEIRSERGLAELNIMVEPTPDHADPANLAQRLENKLSDTFALRISVSGVGCGSLPRFEAKAKRWVRV